MLANAQVHRSVAPGRRVVFRNEGIGRNRLDKIVVPGNITSGVELETFFPSDVNAGMLSSTLAAGGGSGWRIKNDNSIACNPRLPSCCKAELVSPVLRGQAGLYNTFDVLRAIKTHSPSVNKSTGMHVHVGIDGGWTLPQLKRLAHNYVQLESAYDLLMPASRRGNVNRYCRSSAAAATASWTRTKKDGLALVKRAGSIEELKQLLCPDRYMKMNLMALDKHGTVEFRHAGGSQNPAKAVAFAVLWLQLAEASVDSSRSLARIPKKGYAFENLLTFCESSPVLVHWLNRRRLERNPKGANDSTRNTTTRSTQGCSAGCTCSDCR